MRNKKIPKAATPAPSPPAASKPPVLTKPAPIPVTQPVKSVPKEDRESYDDYDVE